MKFALILHGTEGNPRLHWYQWLKTKLEKRGYRVWVPRLPKADYPSMQRYNSYIFANKRFKFREDTIIVGHSSGAGAILGILQRLPKDIQVDTCVFVGVFKGDLGWNQLKGLWDVEIDFKKVQRKSERFMFLHSDDDPYCPLSHAKFFSKELNGELVIQKEAKHFATREGLGGPQFKKLPIILEILRLK